MRATSFALLALAALACRTPELDKEVPVDTGYDPVDADQDGFDETEDCNDVDPYTYPGADELCDGQDNDCDGSVDEDVVGSRTWYPDADGDGWGADEGTLEVCTPPEGYAGQGGDCDDADPSVHPGSPEICDGQDDDCDGDIDEEALDAAEWYADADADGYGDATSRLHACDQPEGYTADDTDCDDTLASVHPGAEEWCDGVDEDCDGVVDDDAVDALTWQADFDGDGWGSEHVSAQACEKPDGYVDNATDCDDFDDDNSPVADETCDGEDNDCDGDVDESDATDALTWYADADADGFGDAASTTPACDQPTGYVSDDSDCDDSDDGIYPGASETCDEVDQDCDGDTDEEATDALTWYADLDSDDWGNPLWTLDACEQPSGYVANDDDCDDLDDSRYPGADETCDGSIDEDCDGSIDEDAIDTDTWYADADGDGYGDSSDTTEACDQPSGYVSEATDCDDTDASVSPDATESCNEVDDDCDGETDEDDASDASTWYSDLDGDGYGSRRFTTVACEQPSGYASTSSDCDDLSADTYPGADELCDDEDNDCDGSIDESPVDPDTWYADADSDGYGDAYSSTTACDQPSGYVDNDDDCDDTDAGISPIDVEICDGEDNDCDGSVDEYAVDMDDWYPDADGDGYGDDTASSTQSCDEPTGYADNDNDCDDADADVHPLASETCDGVDEDCDGRVDEGMLGTAAACPAESCAEVLDDDPSATDGDYYLDPDGSGATLMTCDMTTDGGGWTVVADWDNYTGSDTLTTFESLMTELYNNMGDWTNSSTYIRWSDYDSSADAMAYELPIDVPNDGEALLDVYFYFHSMDDSGTWFFVETASADVNLVCQNDTYTSGSYSAYSSTEKSYEPGYTCPNTGSGSYTWNTDYQIDAGAEVEAFHIHSLHYDGSLGDYSRLYSFSLAVR